ncbi:MAG: hypothetical protein Q9182_006518 [Xanthomendoza sp. 2 TL-2023]
MAQQLIVAWSEVLDIDESEIDENDNFFEIGGDSVMSMRLVGVAQEKNIYIDAEIVFNHPTLSDMRRHCTEAISSPASSSAPALDRDLLQHCARVCQVDSNVIADIVPSTPWQARLLSLHVSAKKSGTFLKTTQLVFEIAGTNDASSVMAAFQAVRDDNQILRTRLVQHEDHVVQVALRDQPHWEMASDLAEYLTHDIATRMNFGDSLIRYAVVHEKEKTFIVWTVHHSVDDEWSRHLLLNGIEQYLLSPLGYSNKPKPPAYNTVAEYVNSNSKDAAAFWQNYLGNSLSPEAFWKLPEGYVPPSAKVNTITQRPLSYKSQEHGGISLATVAYGAFGLASAALSGTFDDSIFLAMRMGRQVPVKGIESIMGPIATMVPFRIRPTSCDTIVDLLRHIRKDSIAMIPFEQLARAALPPPLVTSVPVLNWRLNDPDVLQREITFQSGGSQACFKPAPEMWPPRSVLAVCYVVVRATNDVLDIEAAHDDNVVEEPLLHRFIDCFLNILETMVRRSLKGTVRELLADINGMMRASA